MKLCDEDRARLEIDAAAILFPIAVARGFQAAFPATQLLLCRSCLIGLGLTFARIGRRFIPRSFCLHGVRLYPETVESRSRWSTGIFCLT